LLATRWPEDRWQQVARAVDALAERRALLLAVVGLNGVAALATSTQQDVSAGVRLVEAAASTLRAASEAAR
jgi:hypothetical protein